MYDYIVLITADKEIRMKRSAAGKKLSKYEFNKRERNQLSEHTKMQKADFIFSNNGSKNDLKQKALLLVKLLKSVTA
jgi:dephospho-CoA kinase